MKMTNLFVLRRKITLLIGWLDASRTFSLLSIYLTRRPWSVKSCCSLRIMAFDDRCILSGWHFPHPLSAIKIRFEEWCASRGRRESSMCRRFYRELAPHPVTRTRAYTFALTPQSPWTLFLYVNELISPSEPHEAEGVAPPSAERAHGRIRSHENGRASSQA